jgi:hypothetical protein
MVHGAASFFDITNNNNTWNATFYIDTRLVGDDIVREMVEKLYRTTDFDIMNDMILKRFLNTDRWARGVVPKEMLRNILIHVPIDTYFDDCDLEAELDEHYTLPPANKEDKRVTKRQKIGDKWIVLSC